MKKKIALFLTVALVGAALVGCGSGTANETTNDTTNTVETVDEVESTEVDADVETEVEPTEALEVEVTETPEVVEPNEEVVEENVGTPIAEDMFIDSYQWTFPEGMDGFTDKWIFDDVWSYNQTHYVDTEGIEMNFLWEGPVDLGEYAAAGEKTLALFDANKTYELSAWNFGYTNEDYANCVDLPKETWVSYAPDTIPYTEGDYYNVDVTKNTIKVVFKVSGNGYEGYNYYVIDVTDEICYQFAYFEKTEVYDDARALKVIDSIKYWPDYTPVTE